VLVAPLLLALLLPSPKPHQITAVSAVKITYLIPVVRPVTVIALLAYLICSMVMVAQLAVHSLVALGKPLKSMD
jgi:ABC-type sugar transport system permease subunit